MNYSKAKAAVITAAFFSSCLQAETSLHPVITASRIAQSADQTLAAISVITREDIATSQAQTLPELLSERVPGLDFATAGGKGHQTSTFLRGTNSDHVLFIIDGMNIGSATTGTAQLELIPVEQIERIEVIRGPRSSLYGSEAIGGVIQIFTRKNYDQNDVFAVYGSNNTRAAGAGTGFAGKQASLNIAVSHFATDGFDITNDSEFDNDGHNNNTANLSADYSLSDNTRLFANTLYIASETEFDNDTFANESDSVQQFYKLGLATHFSTDWASSLDIGQSKDHLESGRNVRDFFMPSVINFSETVFTTKRDQAHWQNQYKFGDTGQLAFGVDYINDKVESTTSYSEKERDNTGVYALVQDKFGHHQLQLSARNDNNQAFGSRATGNITWSYDISGELVLSASHGTGFKAPSFNQLYFVDPFFSGNPDLEPETSRSSELALTGSQLSSQWDIRLYRTLIKNLIVTDATFTSVENADRAEIYGIETELSTTLAGINTYINITALDPVDKSTGLQLQNRAERTLKLALSRDVSGYTLGASILAQSSRFANSSNTIELPGYAVVNLLVSKPISKHWTLKARLENILDKEYATTVDFFQNTTNNTPAGLYITLAGAI